MPEGGNIYILSQKEGNTASIEFLATGKGINEELKCKFAKSLTEPDAFEDLGMAIAGRIITNFGGDIKPGPDSTESISFIISLPIYTDYK